jgi:NAD(P)-dependent dehydrogenase (short-subunit alcohol dehydrogenase family)
MMMNNLAITGPTSGIGAETVKKLLPLFDRIFLLARNGDKVQELIQSLDEKHRPKLQFVYMDLTDLDSVRQAAQTIESEVDSLSVLINNAGGIFDKQVSDYGIEKTFATNHLGHFILTLLLMPLLLKKEDGKVINVSSEAHRTAKVDFEDIEMKGNFSSYRAYSNAKLFNILFTKSLHEKYGKSGLKAYALHPGVVKTDFAKDISGVFGFLWKLASPFLITAEQGARTSVFLAKTDLPESVNGAYFKKSKPIKPSKAAYSKRMREKLWEISEKLSAPWLKNQ